MKKGNKALADLYKTGIGMIILIIIFCVCQSNPQKEEAEWHGINDMAMDDEGHLYVAHRKGNIISSHGKRSFQYRTPYEPTGLALSEDGEMFFATAGIDNGVLLGWKKHHQTPFLSQSAGHSPVSPQFEKRAGFVYFCNRFAGTVSAYNLQENSIRTVYVGREPIAATLTPDGKTLIVAHHLPEQPSTNDTVAAKVTFIKTVSLQIIKQVILPNGSSGARDITVSPDGQWAFIPHVLARYTLPTTQLERGWMNTNALTILDLAKQSRHATVLLDDVDYGAANSWGVACSADGRVLAITHAGIHKVSFLDLHLLLSKLEHMNEPENIVGFTSDCRQRRTTTGLGPREIIAHQGRFYVANYFSDTVDIYNSESRLEESLFDTPMCYSPQDRGEQIFHDAVSCFQGWQSCASCHPEARADGLNWDLMNDYIGNPKNAKSLLHAHYTPPMNWTGIRENAEASVRAGMLHIQFTLIDESLAEAMDIYLMSREPIPSPYLKTGQLSASAQQGKRLFNNVDVGCYRCHPPPYYTDLDLHDVGTHTPLDYTQNKDGVRIAQTHFDTPSLLEVWRTAPYLHDGRYVTIKEVITTGNHGDLRGNTSHLSDDETDCLVEYILSL